MLSKLGVAGGRIDDCAFIESEVDGGKKLLRYVVIDLRATSSHQRTYRSKTMPTITITSNDGQLNSASAVLEVSATNPEYNQPALRIKQAGQRGGAASIRIDDPNPDIEFVETGLPGSDPSAGKCEIAVQVDRLQINGRRADNTAFETIVVFQRLAAGGNIGIRATLNRDFGGGQGIIAIANATVAPSETFAGGGILYVEDGALKYRGSNGTVTVIAPA